MSPRTLAFRPSERAVSAVQKQTAWDLMQEIQKHPRYDPDTCPNGCIDLSGAVNKIMRDYVDRYSEAIKNAIPMDEGELIFTKPV